MRMRIINSGSAGNCYVLESKSGKKLLLDIGVTTKEIMKANMFNVKDIVGVIVSHSHG